MSETTRRSVLAGAAGVGAAAVLAACGGTEDTGSEQPAGGQTQGGQQGGSGSISTSEIPVGGGKVYKDRDVVITQPTAGEFKAFSAKCTHRGCFVETVANGTINCPCHQSAFSATDGSVKAGPAPTPLPAKTVTVSGNSITVA